MIQVNGRLADESDLSEVAEEEQKDLYGVDVDERAAFLAQLNIDLEGDDRRRMKDLLWEFRSIFHRFELAFRKRIVVRYMRSTVAFGDAQ